MSRHPSCYLSRFVYFLLWVTVLFGHYHGETYAQTARVNYAYFEDKTGHLSFGEVRYKPFQTIENALSDGYSNSVFWVRIQYQAMRFNEPLFVRIWPNYLDFVCLYQDQVMGAASYEYHPIECVDETISLNHKKWQNVSPVLPLQYFQFHHQKNHFTAYLRIQTMRPVLFYPEVLSIQEVYQRDSLNAIIYGLYCGILVGLIIWGIYVFISDCNGLSLIFSILQVFILITVLTRMGLAEFYFGNYFVIKTNILYQGLVLIDTFLFIIINAIFMRYFQVHFLQRYALYFMIGLDFFNMTLMLMGYSQSIVERNSVVLTLTTALIMPVNLYILYRTKQLKLNFVIGYTSILFVGVSLNFLRLTFTALSFYVEFVNSVFIGVIPLAFFLMHKHSDLIQSKNEALEIKIALTRQEIILEQTQRQHLSDFIRLVANELNLSVTLLTQIFSTLKKSECDGGGGVSKKKIGNRLKRLLMTCGT